MGVSEWEDRKSKGCYADGPERPFNSIQSPDDYRLSDDIDMRRSHRDALCTMTVTSRKAPDDIYQDGHRPGEECLIERNAKPYIDRAIFARFIRHHLLPHIMALRTTPCYSKDEAMLLVDHCIAHVTPEIFRFLGENHVNTVIFAPYTTNSFQTLDLYVFGVFKKRSSGWIRWQ
jgi:hypothetical protein